MDYINLIGGVLLVLYSLVLNADSASIPERQKRQSLNSEDPDRIYFQEEFDEYKKTLQYAQIDESSKRFGADVDSIKQLDANKVGKRHNRQVPPRFGGSGFGSGGFGGGGFGGGFNDITGGGSGGNFGKFPGFFPMRGGNDDDVRPVWDISPPKSSSSTGRPQRQQQETTTLPGPPTWATPPSQCVRNCQVTPQYNPVCGTDGVTYTNMARFQCEVRCGKNIQLNHYGNCSRTTTQAPAARRTASRRRQP